MAVDHGFNAPVPRRDFAVAKEMRRGAGSAIVDALIVQPKVGGIGIDLAKLGRFFKGDRDR